MEKSNYFHGYNCFSSALGEGLKKLNREECLKIINLRWTFDYCKEMEDDNLWFIGACVEPYDYLLQYDINRFCGIEIIEVIPDKKDSIKILEEEIAKNGFQFTMVDFFCMKSIDWNRMERFGFYPRHLPHFIIITEIKNGFATYIDPQYRFTGRISIEELNFARNGEVCHIEIANRYFTFLQHISTEININEYIKYQLYRYVNNKHINKIEMFAADIMEIYDREKYKENNEWFFNTYLSLESIVDMRVAFSSSIININYTQKEELKRIVDIWIRIRKLFFNMYKKKEYRCNENINVTINMLLAVKKAEETFIENYLKI
ncbi:putative NlpC/p60-like peptidase [Fusobacterium sp. CM21]|uniref:hypothetical protein n=1 Tax=Fusobacterium nucleatum TaxID=851 RepID=UPI0003E2A612|nr:hypothetical protein [Fusobacterium nucleatum]ETT13564.1 putative NlpC/p60-like peptidase [Fusobacterium sp. CM21]OHU82017.1 hypothetical protein BKN39_06725 [Fusobacterium nucleatum]